MSLEKILKQMDSGNITLLGQVEVSEQDYNELLNFTREKIMNLSMNTISIMPDLFLSITLVQIAIREYERGNFWQYFLEVLEMNVSAAKRNYLGQIFMKTLREHNLFHIDSDERSNNQYVQNILAHAFVTNNYLEGYFDFIYSFYDRNLLRQIPETIDEEINELKDFMQNVQSQDDYIQLENTEHHTSKAYRLLKSTRYVLAQVDIEDTCRLIIDHLKMLDVYYYEDILPSKNDRFSSAFGSWVETIQNDVRNRTFHRSRNVSGSYSRSPYLEIDKRQEKAYLVIPEQKFRDSEISGQASFVNVSIKGNLETYKLSLYHAYGVIKSEVLRIELDSLFSEIDIEINNTRTFQIVDKDYRIFSEEWTELKQFKVGPCFLLTSKDSNVRSDYPLTKEASKQWDEYFIMVKEDTVVYVDHTPLSIVGEFSEQTLFDSCEDYYVLDSYEQKIQHTSKHPMVSFKVEKSLIDRTFLWINEERYQIDKTDNASILEFPNDHEHYGVSVAIEGLVLELDGEYAIFLDEPGKNKRLLCRYVLLTELVCKVKNKHRFTSNGIAQIILAGEYETTPLNCTQVGTHLYEVDMKEGLIGGEFILRLNGSKYTIHVPTQVFKYKFYDVWYYDRPDYFWYKKLTNELILCLPGVSKASVYMNKDLTHLIEGEEVGENLFKFDISSFIHEITGSNSPWNNLNILYTDSSEKWFFFLKILNRTFINYLYLEEEENQVALCVDYIGDADVFVKVINANDDSIVVDRLEVDNGKNVIPQLNSQDLYTVECYMSESNGFFDTKDTLLHGYKRLGMINPSDISNCRIHIKSMKFKDEVINSRYGYIIRNLEKVGVDDYIGRMYEVFKRKGKSYSRVAFERVRVQFSELFSATPLFYLYVEDGEDWVYFYYDQQTDQLLSSEHELLNSKGSRSKYDRFIELYEDDMTYEIKIRRDY